MRRRELSGTTAPRLFEPCPRVREWAARMAEIGHGKRTDMAPEDALATARDTTPADDGRVEDDNELGLAQGDAVVVSTDDYGRDEVAGELLREVARHTTTPQKSRWILLAWVLLCFTSLAVLWSVTEPIHGPYEQLDPGVVKGVFYRQAVWMVAGFFALAPWRQARTGAGVHGHAAAQVGERGAHVGGAHLDAQDGAGVVLEGQHDGPSAAAAAFTGAVSMRANWRSANASDSSSSTGVDANSGSAT